MSLRIRPYFMADVWMTPEGEKVLGIQYDGIARRKLIVVENKHYEPEIREVREYAPVIWGKGSEDLFEYLHGLDYCALDGGRLNLDAEDLIPHRFH